MKPTAVTDLENKTVQQTIETITDRVDSLGVSEPVIAPYGLTPTRSWWSCPASTTSTG